MKVEKIRNHELNKWDSKWFQFSFWHLQTSNMKVGSKQWSCPYCNKVMNRMDGRAHILVHSGEKPFSCHLCEFSANKKSHIKIHMKTSHIQFWIILDSKLKIKLFSQTTYRFFRLIWVLDEENVHFVQWSWKLLEIWKGIF